jgi:uncharacterized membrane protein
MIPARDRNFHEQLAREQRIVGSSDRSFGITVAAVLVLVGTARLWSGAPGALYWLAAAALVLTVAALTPQWLAPFNRLWLRLGLVLYRVVNPVVMGAVFFLVVTPTALLMRLLGKRPLRLAAEPAATSYWLERRPPGPAADSMCQQF